MSEKKESRGFFDDGEELETIKFISEEEAGIFEEKIELKEAPEPIDAPKPYQAKDEKSWAPKGKRKLIKRIDLPFSPAKTVFVIGSFALIAGLGFVIYSVSKIVMSGMM